MIVRALTLQGIFSFGDAPSTLDEFGPCSIIIGKNNSGKSNILKAIRWFGVHSNWFSGNPSQFKPQANEEFDFGIGDARAKLAAGITLAFYQDEAQALLGKTELSDCTPQWQAEAINLLKAGFTLRVDSSWEVTQVENNRFQFVDAHRLNDLFTPHSKIPMPAKLQGRLPHLQNELKRVIIERLSQQFVFLSGWRRLEEQRSNGQPISHSLRTWERPSASDKQHKRLFARIQQYFHELTLNAGLTLQMDHSGNINIEWNNRYLSIDQYGDGIKHLLILAFEFAIHHQKIMLLEEPETHLHPELQRNVGAFLRSQAENQTITTTHSQVLLDAGRAKPIFRVLHDRVKTMVHRCDTTDEVYDLLDELDVRASDLVQANVAIWVEGPTDRLLLSQCLHLLAPNLSEGLHFQIVYYGGAVRSHLTFDETLSIPLVNLLALSRNAVMVCDSDRKSTEATVNDTKRRLEEECVKVGGFYWITAGREIENYFTPRLLTTAYRELLNDERIELHLPQFGSISEAISAVAPNPGHGDGWKANYDANKARIMPEILKHMQVSDLDHLDLRSKLAALVEYIWSANGGKSAA